MLRDDWLTRFKQAIALGCNSEGIASLAALLHETRLAVDGEESDGFVNEWHLRQVLGIIIEFKRDSGNPADKELVELVDRTSIAAKQSADQYIHALSMASEHLGDVDYLHTASKWVAAMGQLHGTFARVYKTFIDDMRHNDQGDVATQSPEP